MPKWKLKKKLEEAKSDLQHLVIRGDQALIDAQRRIIADLERLI